jgi:hypothetical protein
MKLYRFERPGKSRIETLKKKEIWVACPDDFNDPLDCKLNIYDKTNISSFDETNIKSAAQSLYKNYSVSEGAWLITKEILKRIHEWICDENLSPDKPYFLKLIEERIRSFGVQCFSSAGFSSPLMWAHYAQNHEGFCIEYECNPLEVAVGNDREFSISPAIYTSRLPEFSLMEVLFSPEEVTEKLYATKSEHWAYEREHRLIYFNCSSEKGESVALPKGLKVTRIIAGLKSQEIKGELKSTAEMLGVPIEQIKLSKINYDLIL